MRLRSCAFLFLVVTISVAARAQQPAESPPAAATATPPRDANPPPPPSPAAAPPAPAPEVDAGTVKSFDAIWRDAVEREQARRPVGFALLLGTGLAFAGGGTAIFVDGNSTPTNGGSTEAALGLGMLIGGGLVALLSPLAFVGRDPMEKSWADYQRDTATMTAAARLAKGEELLAQAAAKERVGRITGGVLDLILAGGLGVLGAVALAESGADPVERGVLAYGSWIIGGLFVGQGVSEFWRLGEAERLLRTWRLGTGRPVARLRLAPLVAPAAGGLEVGFSGSF